MHDNVFVHENTGACVGSYKVGSYKRIHDNMYFYMKIQVLKKGKKTPVPNKLLKPFNIL